MKTTEEKDQYSRKQFLRTAGSTALFTTLGIGLYGCGSPTGASEEPIIPPADTGNEDNGIAITNSGNRITLDLTNENLEGLKTEGGWLLISAANTLVVNVDGTVIRSFTSVCTHDRCRDSWGFNNGIFECLKSGGCGHGSRFNTNGEVVRGPATRDLAEFTVVTENDSVTITK